MDPFLGEMVMFAGNFAPRGWALCDGQLLPISQYSALFSILGTTYGGDGRTTFALPDMRGRNPMHPGNGPGLTPKRLGEKSGNERTTLITANLPQSQINIPCTDDDANNSDEPQGRVLGLSETPLYNATATLSMKPGSIIGAANTSFSNESPYTAVNFIIALQGVFPSRN
ncbi:tail fiber protein [Saprospiraceae bacterium]|nr:tail fiber protein [Saprospiraceae bacterium]